MDYFYDEDYEQIGMLWLENIVAPLNLSEDAWLALHDEVSDAYSSTASTTHDSFHISHGLFVRAIESLPQRIADLDPQLREEVTRACELLTEKIVDLPVDPD